MRDVRKMWVVTLVLALLAGLSAVPAAAQQTDENKPAGPYPSLDASDSSSKDEAGEKMLPDSNPLTGLQLPSLGHSSRMRSFFQPSFSFSQAVDSNAAYSNGSPARDYISYVSGAFSLDRRSEHQHYTLDYTGGGTFYQNNTNLDNTYHHADLTSSFMLQRWQLTLADRVGYTPESPFGYSGLAGSGEALRSELVPNQSILSGRQSQLTNSVAADVAYRMSARNVFTVRGSYGILRFLNDSVGLNDNNQWTAGMGFNRHLNARDTVALQYEHSRFRYPEQVGGVDTDLVAAVYSRRVSGRMSVEVSGGPQFVQLSGLSRLGPLAALMQPMSVQYNVGGSLLYHRGRNDFNLSTQRGVTGGSGLMQGAETLAVNGGFSRGLGRSWHMDLNGGYSRNQTLANALLNRQLTFTGVFGGVRLSRNLGRSMGTFLSYNVQQQNSMNGVCSGPACGDRLRHVVTIGFDWHPRAIPIE